MRALMTILAFCAIPVLAAAQNPPANPRSIHIRDYCDPATFNPVLGDGACVRDTTAGFITLSGFSDELGAERSVGAWRFAPLAARVKPEARLRSAIWAENCTPSPK